MGWNGRARQGSAGPGMAWRGKGANGTTNEQRKERLGEAGFGRAWPGPARQGHQWCDDKTRRGSAGLGQVRHGWARLGSAGQGSQWLMVRFVNTKG